METRTLKLVIQYDGAQFSGWQRQADGRTVQGVLEDSVQRLCGLHVAVLGAGRTDAGVHALGQVAGIRVPMRWDALELKRALNAVLPLDIRVASADTMKPEFHARFSAVSRSYRYLVGTDEEALNPFRRKYELAVSRPLDKSLLDSAARSVVGDHCFRAFAVKGTAPLSDHHRCIVQSTEWAEREGGLMFLITANRFLHHMVRFLVGTMLDIGMGKRDPATMCRLLEASDNSEVSTPVAPHGLYLERVEYPLALHLVNG